MKKVLMIFLAIALIFTMSAPVFAAAPGADLTVQQKFDELKAAGILAGDANGNMLPADKTMTRQELAKIACTLSGVAPTPGVEIAAFAKDYKKNVWGFDQGWIQAAYTTGLMKGKGAAGFDSQGVVSIAELLTVVIRTMGLGAQLDNSKWEASAMEVAIANKLIPATGVTAKEKATYAALVTQSYNSYAYNLAKKDFQVHSVRADNGKTVKITFNKAVDGTTVATAGKLINVTFTKIGSAPAVTEALADATLSADKKTLTIVPQGTEVFNGKYAVNVAVAVKDVDGKSIVPYAGIVDLTDNVRPTVVGVSYPTANTAKVTFSEPIKATNGAALVTNNLQVKHPITGFVVGLSGLVTLAGDNQSFMIDTTTSPGPTTFSTGMPVPYDLSLVGIEDFAGNMLNPNPTKVPLDPEAQDDTVPPTLVNIEALGVGAAKITFSEKMNTTLSIKINNGAAIPLVIGSNASVDSTGTVFTTNGIAGLTGTVNVEIDGATDLAGNALASGNQYPPKSKFVTFVPDNTAPKYVSNSIETISGINYLLVKFDENVAFNAGAPAGTYVDTNSITQTVTINGAVTQHVVAPATKSDTVKIVLTGEVAGTYNVVLPAGFVKDISTNANSSLQAAITFTVGAQLDPSVPVATIGTIQATEDTVIVTYDKDVTAATALNVANYKVDGNNVFTSALFMGNAKTVHLKLAPGAITINGNYQMQVANVATAAGKVIVPVSKVVEFKDNVKPTITKAALASPTTITATFSKKVTSTTINAFEVYKNGVKIATGVSATAPANTDKVTITIPSVDLSATYTVKFIGTDFVDANGNTAVSGNTVTMTQ